MAPIGSESPVHVENFRMDFGRTTVIRDLSFDIKAGETFGFLGSNGSGKTTTISALLGIYIPTAGTLHINGQDFSPELGGKLGYLPEERGLYRKESVIDVMTYFGRLKGLSKHDAATWSVNYLEQGWSARTCFLFLPCWLMQSRPLDLVEPLPQRQSP